MLFHVTEDTVKTPFVSLCCCMVSGGAGGERLGNHDCQRFCNKELYAKGAHFKYADPKPRAPGPAAAPGMCLSPGGPSSGGRGDVPTSGPLFPVQTWISRSGSLNASDFMYRARAPLLVIFILHFLGGPRSGHPVGGTWDLGPVGGRHLSRVTC